MAKKISSRKKLGITCALGMLLVLPIKKAYANSNGKVKFGIENPVENSTKYSLCFSPKEGGELRFYNYDKGSKDYSSLRVTLPEFNPSERNLQSLVCRFLSAVIYF